MGCVATVAEAVVRGLEAWGVPWVAGLGGDTVGPLVAALRASPRLRYVGVRQPDAAGFMASAWAKLTGEVGVCLADGGPGCVGLLQGVYDAHLDRAPLLALTGQVPTAALGGRWPQAMDQDLVYHEAAGAYDHTLVHPGQAPHAVHRALAAATERRDAARLGIPVDLQGQPAEAAVRPRPRHLGAIRGAPGPEALARACRLLALAARPVVVVGRGARGAVPQVLELARRLDAAVVHTLPALGMVPAAFPGNLGVVGAFGTAAAAHVFAQADVVVAVGTTWWQPAYAPDAAYVQVDAVAEHAGTLLPAEVALVGDARVVLDELLARLPPSGAGEDRAAWRAEVAAAREAWARARRGVGRDGVLPLHPAAVVEALARRIPEDAVLCLDVGAHTYWLATRWDARVAAVLLSGHWRSMGFALPAANAACLAAPARPVVAVVGDGGLGSVLAEFTTAVHHGLPPLVVVLRDDAFAGEAHAPARSGGTAGAARLTNPDFAAYARGAGGVGLRVDRPEGLDEALAQAFRAARAGRPTLLEVPVRPEVPTPPEPEGDLVRAGRAPAVPVG